MSYDIIVNNRYFIRTPFWWLIWIFDYFQIGFFFPEKIVVSWAAVSWLRIFGENQTITLIMEEVMKMDEVYYCYLVSYSTNLSNTRLHLRPFDLSFGCLLFMSNKQNNHHARNECIRTDMSWRESLMVLILATCLFILFKSSFICILIPYLLRRKVSLTRR